MNEKKYYVQMSKPDSLAILGGDDTPEGAVADAKANHAAPDRFGGIYAVSAALGEAIEERGDCEDLCFRVLGEGKLVRGTPQKNWNL